MRSIDFGTGWTVRRHGSAQKARRVTIPHDAMLEEPRCADAPGGTNTGWFRGGDYIYEKEFVAPDAWRGGRLVLEFEGVYRKAHIRLNGEDICFRPYGYTNFYVDLTEKLRYGRSNHLEVTANNSDQPNSRWYSGAGIYRPVRLWIAPSGAYIPVNGVRLRTRSINPPTVEIEVDTVDMPDVVDTMEMTEVTEMAKMRERSSLSVELLEKGSSDRMIAFRTDECSECIAETYKVGTAGAEISVETGENRVIRRYTCVVTVPDAKLWDVDTPRLYTCRVRCGEDVVEETFGFRTIQWGKEGLLLNDRRVILKGACIHHDHGVLGACCYSEAEERRVRLLKETGYNALRSAHNPCSKALLAACDRQGMLVMDEYIDHWYIHKTEYDYVEYFKDWWRKDLADMVAKDYNHPCVILYSTGNEVSETAQKQGIALTGAMTRHLHRLDPTRPVTCGVNIFFNFLSSVGLGVYSDEKAKKEAKRNGRKGRKKAVGSQFFNNLAGLLGADFMKWGATLHGCDIKTRDAFARMDIAGYNYGICRYERDLARYPDRLILGSETFCSDADQFMRMAKKYPRVIGDFVWAGMDYLGEVGVGSWEYRDDAPRFDGGPGWVSAGSGRLDLTGKPLGEALYTKVALGKEPGPYIAVRPVHHTGEKHSPSAWKMTDAIDSWSWRGCEGRTAQVEVYARAARCALFLNGRRIGVRAMKGSSRARFSCPYENGSIMAISYDSDGREIGRRTLRTAGEDTRLRLEPEQPVGDGTLRYIRIRYTDEHGVAKPMESGTVRLRLRGGTLLGIGNGCPYQRHSFRGDRTRMYRGEALAVVRVDAGADVMHIYASDGIRSECIRVPVH